jgi:hypothetical protein
MDLIFWRHAEALDAIDGQEDVLRTCLVCRKVS